MSRRTKENKGKSLTRKAQALVRVGGYYQLNREESKNSVEYLNYKRKRTFRMPKLLNPVILNIINYLTKDKIQKEGGDA